MEWMKLFVNQECGSEESIQNVYKEFYKLLIKIRNLIDILKEDIHENNHKEMIILLAMSRMQNETTMRYHFTPIISTKSKNIE